MEFYNRKEELRLLDDTRKLSGKSAMMTVITGRRRIGKTTLAIKAFERYPALYFFVARKSEILLCREFIEEIEMKLRIRVLGEFNSFAKLFEYLMVQAQTQPFTLIIDEFQEFSHINGSVYSEIQNLWDRYKATSGMNLVLSGSVYSMMKKIFENEKEPLFGRANERINLQPFNVNVIKSIVTTKVPDIRKADLLAFYTITGGVAKYVELFVDKGKFTFNQMLGEIFREKLALSGMYTRLGCYWERRNRNELDIVAIDDLHNKALIAEVKMNKKKFRPNLLKDNAHNLITKLDGFEIEYKSLSLEDI